MTNYYPSSRSWLRQLNYKSSYLWIELYVSCAFRIWASLLTNYKEYYCAYHGALDRLTPFLPRLESAWMVDSQASDPQSWRRESLAVEEQSRAEQSRHIQGDNTIIYPNPGALANAAWLVHSTPKTLFGFQLVLELLWPYLDNFRSAVWTVILW
jgi:hypothetical protein